jgi:hypothetical protein
VRGGRSRADHRAAPADHPTARPAARSCTRPSRARRERPGERAGGGVRRRAQVRAPRRQREPAARRPTSARRYERGEVTDIAKVMLARQEGRVAFEATLQVRNKLLSALPGHHADGGLSK